MTFQEKIKVIFTKAELVRLIYIFIGILIMGFFEVIGVSSIAPFIAVVTSPELIHENIYLNSLYVFFDFQTEVSFIVFIGICVISILFISNGYLAFMNSVITYFSCMQTSRLQIRLLENYLMKPYSFFLDRNTSDLGKNILVEVNRVTTGYIMQLLQVFSKIIIALFLFSLLLFVNPTVAITVIVVLGSAYWGIFKLVRQRLQKIGEATTKGNFIYYRTAGEAMSGIKDIKLRSSEDEFTKRFAVPSKKLHGYTAQRTIISYLPRYLFEVIAFGGIVGIIILLISTNTLNNANTIMPIISLYVMAGYRLMPALQQIYSGLSNIKFNHSAFEALVLDFSSSTNEKVEQIKYATIPFKDKFEISQLSFSYENSDAKILDKLNLTVFPNTTVGIVGSTGSGKTTLIDLLLGLLVPESGFISLDGVEINKHNISAWQNDIGYVPQSIYLTDDTIEANIAFTKSRDEINIDKAIKAAKMANLHEFITTLSDQYKTFVGERGVRLSGGQRQRIGIARALYHNPRLLVLDEATSSLDGITENAIMDAINNLSHKKTIIMIAHRLSTVKGCDIIHFMSNGQIIDSGTYQQLIESNEEFKRMADHL